MSDFKCTFCNSDKLRVEKPYMVKKKTMQWGEDEGLFEMATDYCCKSQARNQEYIRKRYHPTHSRKPTSEEVAKW